MKLAEKLETATNVITRAEGSDFDRIDFDFEGITLHAFSEKKEKGGHIHLKAQLGRLFYTIEDSDRRTMAIERIKSANRGIDGAYSIDRHSTVHFQSLTGTDEYVVGDHLVKVLTLIILEAEPHLRSIKHHLSIVKK